MNKVYGLVFAMFVLINGNVLGQNCNPPAIYNNDSVPETCIEVINNVRHIYTNNLPSHPFGPWPTGNVPTAQDYSHTMCAYPIKAQYLTTVYGNGAGVPGCTNVYRFGITTNGIGMVAWAALYFVDTAGQNNLDWNIEATTLNLDAYGAHVPNSGEYHYHVPPAKYYADSLGVDGTAHSPLLGYAADGFPVYYKYVYSNPNDSNSPIIALNSCYNLKVGNRPGDGLMAPNGPYDGTYTEDYEYTAGAMCELDSCNGRYGVTPEYPNGTYYYVMTDGFPYMPRCFYGTVPDPSFLIGPQCPASNAQMDCSIPTSNHVYLSNVMDIALFPNPTSDKVFIKTAAIEQYQELVTKVAVFDAMGKTVFVSNQPVQEVDVTNWASGDYFVQIEAGERQMTKKVVVR